MNKSDLEDALIRAHESGDFEAAKLFANEIRSLSRPVTQFVETQGGAATGRIVPRRALMQAPDTRPETDPSRGRGTLQFGPIDTGIPLSEGVTNLLSGAGREFYQTARGAGQIIGVGPTAQQVDEIKAMDAPLLRTGPGTAGAVIGNLAQIAPTMLIPGVNSVVGSSAVGGALGALRPVGENDDRLSNTLLSAVLSGGTTGLLQYGPRAYTALRNAAIERFGATGQQRAAAAAVERAAGGPAEMANVLNRVDAANRPAVGPFRPGLEARTAGELVPGSVPTLAEIAQNPGIAAMQRTAGQTIPSVMAETTARATANNEARAGLLNHLAGDRLSIDEAMSKGLLSRTGGGLLNAQAQRAATAKELYENAAIKGVDFTRDAATGKFLGKAAQAAREAEITKLANVPEIKDAIAAASRNLANRQVTNSPVMQRLAREASENPMNTVLGLDAVRKELGYEISKAMRAGDKSQVELLTNIRSRFDTTFDAISPEYTVARKSFQAMSVPVNQMQVASEIATRATSPTGNVTLSGLNNALRNDAIAVKATGFPGAKLDDIFNNEQVNLLNALRKDLERKSFAESAARAGSDTIQKGRFSGLLDDVAPAALSVATQSPLLSRLVTGAVDVASKGSRKKAEEQLARMLLNPTRQSLLAQPLPPAIQVPDRYLNLGPLASQMGLLGYAP